MMMHEPDDEASDSNQKAMQNFVARGFIAAGLRSGPKPDDSVCLEFEGAASRASGDKSPRHRFCE
ncbi:hypothetical protein CD58_12015 [Pseudomonas brassicacearum]|nr:hypothetical protein CD58_12015 [Pseudomonas brassicacearum]